MSYEILSPDEEGDDLTYPENPLYRRLVDDYEAQQFGGTVLAW